MGLLANVTPNMGSPNNIVVKIKSLVKVFFFMAQTAIEVYAPSQVSSILNVVRNVKGERDEEGFTEILVGFIREIFIWK